MAYSKTNNTSTTRVGQTLNNNADIELKIRTNDGEYICSSQEVYTDSSNIIQEISAGTQGTTSELTTLTEFSKDLAALTAHSAKTLLIKNSSNIGAEVVFQLRDWKDDSDTDVRNLATDLDSSGTSDKRYISMLLPAGKYAYLPTSRIVSYTPADVAGGSIESAAFASDGTISELPSGVDAAVAGTTKVDGSDLATVVNPETFTVDTGGTDNASMFKVGDLIKVDSEVMKVASITGNTLTVDRGLFGTTIASHADNADVHFYYGNEYLKASESLCMTDQNGQFKQSGAFFGKARTSDKVADGLCPGSVAIGPFYTKGGNLDWGLENIKASDETGLAASTTYTFHIVVDEFSADGFDSVSSEAAIAFTTDSSDTTFAGSGNAVLPKIQARFDALYYDSSSGLHNKKVEIAIVNGDIRVTSLSNNSNTRVGIGNVSGTTPFGVGRFPALSSGVPVLEGTTEGGGTTDSIVFGPKAALNDEEIEDPVTNKTIVNTDAFIFDDGNGNLLYQGSVVGQCNYEKGHLEFAVSSLPKAQFNVQGQSHSAHSGGVSYVIQGYNSISSISVRSVNHKANTKIELILLG
jgi:hypothetical protein